MKTIYKYKHNKITTTLIILKWSWKIKKCYNNKIKYMYLIDPTLVSSCVAFSNLFYYNLEHFTDLLWL